jgi:hypothetical protein
VPLVWRGDVLAWGMASRTLALPLLAALGCSSTPPGPDEAGVTTDPSTTSESESGYKFDIAPLQDSPMPACWLTHLTAEEANAAAAPDCSFGPFDPGLPVGYLEVCVERPPTGDCASICPPNALCEGMETCYGGEANWLQMCGPNETVDSCCVLLVNELVLTG